ncbi:sensor domain-containing diguanylate cyclase [Legionella nautarum]|nr:sensor domain-containing diguanylate cyclase [Legionella nautarum]
MLVFNHLLRGLFLLKHALQSKQEAKLPLSFWKWYFIINNLQSGILWALGGLLFLYIPDPMIRLIIFIFLTGIIGAPSAKLMTFYLAYLGFLLPGWLVMLAIAFSLSSPVSIILFAAIILYTTMLLLYIHDAHQQLVKSIYLELYSSNLLVDLKRSEEYFRNTVENAPIGMAIISPEGKFQHANRTMQEILGYTDEELKQKTILEATHKNDIAITRDAMHKLIKNELHISHMEKRFIQKDGNIIWAMVSASLIRDEQGNPINFIIQMKDVSDRIENEEKMRKLNEKTMSTLNELKLLEHDENLLNKLNRSLQICVKAEEAYPRILLIAEDMFPELSGGLSVYNKDTNQMDTVIQWGSEQIIPKHFFPMDCFAIREANINLVDDPKKSIPCSHYLTPPEGGYIGVPLMMQSELVGVIHFLAKKDKKLTQHEQDMATSFGNIIKLALANINLRASLSELSLHDALTNLYNRRYLNDILTRELIRIARDKRKLCVAMMDLDDFKKFNDTYSHLAGDQVLKTVGELLMKNFRGSDISFRFGGEEFVVVLLNTDLNNAFKKMEKFSEILRNTPIIYKDKRIPSITISIGLAEAPLHGAVLDDIIKAADHALYVAKQSGKDQVKAFN